MNGVQYRVAENAASHVRLRCVSPAFESPAFEFALRQSPRMALGPTLRGLKRAAEAKKCQRIAGRLAALAGAGRARRVQFGLGKRVRTALC